MDIIKLKQFLVNAKKNTYASGGENQAKASSDSAKEYIFEENSFKYIDRYKGHEKFEGREEVLENNEMIWEMYYNGSILSNQISANDVYSFLRKALKQISKDQPFRGPAELIDGEYRYVNNTEGDIEEFSGEEQIFCKDELVYKLIYNGKIIN